jgi:hypothetical protein
MAATTTMTESGFATSSGITSHTNAQVCPAMNKFTQ